MDVAGFEELRPYLFSVAYRMLGRATEAEDVVQDAWVRYQTAAPVAVE
jgi:RNA polymerase sigma-70 factor (ECF subfamily)